MMTKIALFLPSLDGGGAERVLVSLANGLTNEGFSVDFVLAHAHGPYLSDLNPKINLINLNKRHVIFSVLGLGFYLRTHRPSVIISGLSNANAAVILASKIFSQSCSTVITQHINWSEVMANNPTFQEKIIYHLSKYLYPFATRIVAISSCIADEIKRIKNVDPLRVIQIYNPVLTSEMMELSKQPTQHPWLVKKEEPVLLAVGRLSVQKDFTTLIRSFHKVQSQFACKLIVLGEGPERQKLEKLIQDLGLGNRIDLHGFSTNPYAYMAAADLFVLSSLYEGLPTVLIEAMACGLPVIATDCISGPNEILMGGKYGVLVPVRDIDALTQSIINKLQTPGDKNLIQVRAQDFSVDKATKSYTRLIDELIKSQ